MLAATIGDMLSPAKKAQCRTTIEIASPCATPPHLGMRTIVARKGAVNGAHGGDCAAAASHRIKRRTSADSATRARRIAVDNRFDAVTTRMSGFWSRRRAVHALGAFALGSLGMLGGERVAEAKNCEKKCKRHCVQ